MTIPPHVRQRLAISGRLFLAASALFCTIAIGGFVGWSLAEWLIANDQRKIGNLSIAWGSGAVGVAFIIGAGKQILIAFKKFYDYVRLGAAIKIYPDCVSIGATVALISVTAMLPKDSASVQSKSLSEVIYLTRTPAAAEALATFPLLYPPANGSENGWSRGVEPSEHQKEDLRKLMATLAACVGDEPHQDVVIRVRGFADSNEFKLNGGRNPQSDDLNRRAANLRATNVFTTLREFLPADNDRGPSRIILEFKPYVDALGDPPYFDRPMAETGVDQGYLNRSVKISLLRAGVCERVYADPPPPDVASPSAQRANLEREQDNGPGDAVHVRQARNRPPEE
ncbi:MAG: hypothetical protein D6773_03050 [Alphaproteobacteria bacterium]|nr:MAG: hypothetical protein D6773_03050 [Alphaproteobacteria bacterium]